MRTQCNLQMHRILTSLASNSALMLSRSFSSAATASSPASCAFSGFFASIINSDLASFQDENL